MAEMDEIVSEFLIESHEGLDQLDRDLLMLEREPSDQPALASAFRTIHTIKGTCGFLGFSKLESVAHVGEGLLHRLRDGEMTFSSAVGDLLLEMADAVKEILSSIETGGAEGDGDYADLVRRLSEAQEGSVRPARSRRTARSATPGGGADRHRSLADGTIRVDVGLLDRLMNLVGELVLARNQLREIAGAKDNAPLARATQRLSSIAGELQEGVMKTRMQPISRVWGGFQRLVRDTSAGCGKRARLELEGGGTELDRSILEAIKDPLTHLLRNAVDHGIEPPAVRSARGKAEEGRIRIAASHEHGQVILEVSDDGAGIDVDRVKRKALETGLVSSSQIDRMGAAETLGLIFLPGLTTASTVTAVSGRGVGMDVVRANIEKIGGIIDIASRPDEGTRFTIKIPLTLAIVPALIVSASGDRFAVPEVSLVEILRLEGERARAGIEILHDVPVHRLRGELLPIVYLDRELGLGGREALGLSSRRKPAGHEASIDIVVLQIEGRPFGLVVDEVGETEEVVVKPLGQHVKGLRTFAGATILGDGRVALILDVFGLAQRAGILAEGAARAARRGAAPASAKTRERQTLLLFRSHGDGRIALPLSTVARLEEIPRAQVERAGLGEVVQYRGRILPLLRLSERLGEPEAEPGPQDERLQVVVWADGTKSVGLVVDQILDIVEEPLRLERRSSRQGISGTAVIQHRVTEILDMQWILRGAGAPAVELTATAGAET